MIDTDLLDVVVTTPLKPEESAWFQLLIGPINGKMREEWHQWPEDKDKILTRVAEITDTNVYFSPHLFSEKSSNKQYVLPSRTLCVDLDNADITNLQLNPTVMLETSPGRHQGFWVLKDIPKDFEVLSKKLSYTIENADHSGWPIGHKFRLLGVRNFKYNPPPVVHLIHNYTTERIFTEDEMFQWVGSTDVALEPTTDTDSWINTPPTTHVTGPLEVLEKYRANVGVKALSYYNDVQADRSEALWALMTALFRAGASRDEVYWVAFHSANNKFLEHTHNAERDLAKDVDRAEKSENLDKSDISQVVQLAEKNPGTKNEQKRLVANIVFQDMNKRGEFIQTEDGRYWFLHSNAGRPIPLGRHSDQLNSILDAMYGLNQSDGIQPFVCHHLLNHTINRGRTAKTSVLSALDKDGTTLLLHGGRQDVYRITPDTLSRHPDGQFGVLFPWRPLSEQEITLDDPIADDWAEWVFVDWFDNLLDFTPKQAKILVRIWILFILFRDAAVSRPILALLGQQGSGKSTLFHILYTILYGGSKSLNAISSIEDFDFLTSSDPFVVFDNVDSWTGWLPDRLALAASSSDLVKRKLYTDSDTITLKRQAVLGITAHEPKFGRPDVVDRLLIINLTRRQKFSPESSMIERVIEARPKIWGAIVNDCQKVLATPDVAPEDVPNFRISDFARLGARIAKAIDCSDEFVDIIGKLRKIQTAFSLGEDDILVDALKRYQTMQNGKGPEYVSAGYLWEYIIQFDRTFASVYKTSNALARKLITMEPNLRSMFEIDYKYDNSRGIRTWRIEPLDD